MGSFNMWECVFGAQGKGLAVVKPQLWSPDPHYSQNAGVQAYLLSPQGPCDADTSNGQEIWGVDSASIQTVSFLEFHIPEYPLHPDSPFEVDIQSRTVKDHKGGEDMLY